MHREVGNGAIKRSGVNGLAKNVIHARELRLALTDVSLGGIELRARLGDAGLVLGCYGFRDFISGFFGVKILLGNELVLVKVLSAIVIELGASEVAVLLFD